MDVLFFFFSEIASMWSSYSDSSLFILIQWKGLDNYGNTCYVNVIVQALFFCPGFPEALSQFVADITIMLVYGLFHLPLIDSICSLLSSIIYRQMRSRIT